MEKNEESQESLYEGLAYRLKSLEVSHTRLKEQFDLLMEEHNKTTTNESESSDSCDLTSYPGWSCVRGIFSESLYRNVLEYMGQAVYVSKTVSGEILYWNRCAEKLYGYKDYEILGQRVADLLIDEEHYVQAKKIMERVSYGHSWSGQFPFRKRCGEKFMAMVTKSSLYEDGQLVGIITVSSDAAMFNNIDSENLRTYCDRSNGQRRERGVNLKKLQWHPQPQFAASLSNLASKVLLRKQEDDAYNGCTNSKDKEETTVETEDVKLEKPPKVPATKSGFGLNIRKSTTDGESSQKEESTFKFVQPSKIATKVLSKLQIGGTRNHDKEKDESIQHCSLADTAVGNEVNVEPNSSRGLKATTSYCCAVDAEYEGANPHKRNSPFAAKRVYINVNGHKIPEGFKEGSSFETFSRESKECYEVSKVGDQLPDLHDPKVLEIGDAVQQQASSGESNGSCRGSPSSKGDNESNLVDCEIRWEDIHFREEIGRGSYGVVYHGIWNGSDVAVKVYFGNEYNEGTSVDYKKEVDIMRRLRHPNVLLFMGAVYSEEKHAIVTEFLPRGSLFRTLHKNNQSLDMRRRLRMALDVARGMNYLHHRHPPIVHRDLKSSNLLVDKNCRVKVGDFGLSKLKDATFLTAKSGRGTPQWMAPEVLRNDPSNEKSDVFSFGVILWEIMTESIPWNNLNSLQVVGVVGFQDRRLDIPEAIDPRISSIICDCWKSNPEHRPSFEDIIQGMADLIRTIPAASVGSKSEQP